MEVRHFFCILILVFTLKVMKTDWMYIAKVCFMIFSLQMVMFELNN